MKDGLDGAFHADCRLTALSKLRADTDHAAVEAVLGSCAIIATDL